jgi:hypothetical protein
MFKLLWILCKGHDINVMYFSEVMQLKLVTFCDYKQMHSILDKIKFHALLVGVMNNSNILNVSS